MKKILPIQILKKLIKRILSRQKADVLNVGQGRDDSKLEVAPRQSLDVVSTFGNRNLELEQRGLNLSGKCYLPEAKSTFLVAMVKGHVVGSCYVDLASIGDFESTCNYVQVSMDLNEQLLYEYLNEDIEFIQYNCQKKSLLTISTFDVFKGNSPSIESLESLVPSYGFFGGVKDEPLKLAVSKKLTAITFRLACDSPSILNLKMIEINDEHGKALELSNIDVEASSTNVGTEPGQNILLGKGFHSAREIRPWLTVKFKQSVFVSSVQITNRRDKWGLRSQRLEVTTFDSNGVSSVLYAPSSKSGIYNFYAQTYLLFGMQCIQLIADKGPREGILELILYKLKNTAESQEHARHALKFLSTWSIQKANVYNELEIKILAYYIHHTLTRAHNLSLLPFSKILTRGSCILLLEEEVNLHRKASSLAPIKFTKHGVASAGKLVTNASKVLHAIDEIIPFLSKHGLNPSLAYGTLLGAVREQAFIPYDDDIDLLVECPESVTNLKEAFNFKNHLLELLSTNEYSTYAEATAVLHLVHKGTRTMVDIFPYWKAGGKVYLYMEKMKPRAIDATIFDGRTQVSLHGHSFPAPAKPAQFLLERYGEKWEIADKFHEWPWQLEDL